MTIIVDFEPRFLHCWWTLWLSQQWPCSLVSQVIPEKRLVPAAELLRFLATAGWGASVHTKTVRAWPSEDSKLTL